MDSADELVEAIRRRLEQRQDRPSPPGAPGGPDAPVELQEEVVQRALERLAGSARFDPGRISSASRSPAGRLVHRLAGRVVSRQTAGILGQVQDFADACRAALELVARRPDPAGVHSHPLLAAQVDAALDRLVSQQMGWPAPGQTGGRRGGADRGPDEGTGRAASGGPSGGPDRGPSGGLDRGPSGGLSGGLSELVDGPRQEAVARRAALVGLLPAPVLDVAAGRGDLLDALAQAGVAARGAEADPYLVAQAVAAGLAVVRSGPMVSLGQAGDASVGAVAALGVVERLGSAGAADLVGLAAAKIRPGGRLVIESVDPAGPAVWSDPRTVRPQDPGWLAWVCGQDGFGPIALERQAEGFPGARPGHYLLVATARS